MKRKRRKSGASVWMKEKEGKERQRKKARVKADEREGE